MSTITVSPCKKNLGYSTFKIQKKTCWIQAGINLESWIQRGWIQEVFLLSLESWIQGPLPATNSSLCPSHYRYRHAPYMKELSKSDVYQLPYHTSTLDFPIFHRFPHSSTFQHLSTLVWSPSLKGGEQISSDVLRMMRSRAFDAAAGSPKWGWNGYESHRWNGIPLNIPL